MREPQHICMIGPVPPPWGGVQTHMMQLRERIRSNGMRCSMLNHSRHRQADADDVYYPASAQALWNRLKILRPDVIHIHLGGGLFNRELSLFVALRIGFTSRQVLTFHSGGFPSSDAGRNASRWSYTGFCLRRLDAVISVNAELGDVFRRFGVAKDARHVIPPFAQTLDRSVVIQEALPPAIESFRQQHHPLLLSVGLLEPEYGLDVQLDAFEFVRKTHPMAGLIMIGSGTLHDRLRDRIAEHSCSSHILLAGDVPREKTLASIAQADLLLRTTHYDGDAMSIREALALGTRVLATDNGMRPAGVHLLARLDAATLSAAIGPALDSTVSLRSPTDSDGSDSLDAVLNLYKQIMAEA